MRLTRFAALWLLTACLPVMAGEEPALRPDRVVSADATDPAYTSSGCGSARRREPSAATHLLVYRSGVCVLDRGLRDRREAGASDERSLVERGLIDEAFVAPDGRGALIATTRYRDSVALDSGGLAPTQSSFEGGATLTWIDPDHPDGRWTQPLEAGRFVKEALVLSLGLGIAMSTTTEDGSGADFRLMTTDGQTTLRLGAKDGTIVDIAAPASGGCVAVDIARPELATLPDREVRVYDLVRGTHWTYAWRYGSDDEPTSWTLEDDGVLEVKLPGTIRRFDREGHPTAGSHANGSKLFNRIRN